MYRYGGLPYGKMAMQHPLGHIPVRYYGCLVYMYGGLPYGKMAMQHLMCYTGSVSCLPGGYSPCRGSLLSYLLLLLCPYILMLVLQCGTVGILACQYGHLVRWWKLYVVIYCIGTVLCLHFCVVSG